MNMTTHDSIHLNVTSNDLKPGTIVSPRKNGFHPKPQIKTEPNHLIRSTPTDHLNSDLPVADSGKPFILKQKLAEGAYAAVYKAVYGEITNDNQVRETSEFLAVKIMTNPGGLSYIDGSSVGALVEMDIMARLRHPHLLSMSQITIVDLGIPTSTISGQHPKTTLAISMPLAEDNLADYMERHSLSLPEKLNFIKQILLGVDYLHSEQILHLDLKLENVLVLGNPLRVVIADFGLSIYTDFFGKRFFDRESITLTYRPPELFVKSKEFDRSSDVWSVGMLALYLLMGVKHIFPDIKTKNVKNQLTKTMKDKDRLNTLHNYLKPIIRSESERSIVCHFLDRCLSYTPINRGSTSELINHQVFTMFNNSSNLNQAPRGISLYPSTWMCPPENIGIEPYLAINFMIRLTTKINPLIETYFIAIDFFHRSLANLYLLHGYFQKMDNVKYSLTEVISLGALTSVWIALKANDYKHWNAKFMVEMVSGYNCQQLIEMERHLVVGLRGIIYRWNLFKEATTRKQLIDGFELTTNPYKYSGWCPEKVTNRQLSTYSSERTHYAKFNEIYIFTKYYNESLNNTPENICNNRFALNRKEIFPY
jgi:serine/threonine protein kinase